jgi:hypothetical protein
MVICPIARTVHCTGCFLVKICPAKTILGDFGKNEENKNSDNQDKPAEEKKD